ncbi:MAG: D-alanine--D-alanine ligase, partial [Clostridia bacterium]|nr:D-alanine--D-alanine ligase [Clostridia bacterium]
MKSVCIVCGGQSHEHEISLISAYSVLCNIDRTKYDVHTIIIDEDGNLFHSKQLAELKNGGWKSLPDLTPCIITQGGGFDGLLIKTKDGYEELKIDVFFPVLHGENGEDGVIQGLFKMSGTAYVGNGVLASATCMDKEMTHMRLDATGIKTAAYIVARRDGDTVDALDAKIVASLGYPVFVKPANAGSSVGVGKAKDKKELESVLETAFEVD